MSGERGARLAARCHRGEEPLELDHVRLSKTISHALRHEPEVYGLELDEGGWADLGELVDALRARRRVWSELVEADLHEMLAQSERKRFEIRAGRMRALYGHSLERKLKMEPAEPPELLYHGTPAERVGRILAEGLLPMDRQYVHLSLDRETALRVGERRDPGPVILVVRAREAHRGGIGFYEGNETTWLADSVPAEFIETAESIETDEADEAG